MILVSSATSNWYSITSGWLTRITAAGGARPSTKTIAHADDFWRSLVANNLSSKMKIINLMVPDNLVACCTPFYASAGANSWTNHNFTSGDLTVNGLVGNGTTKYLDTVLNPSLIWTTSNCGITTYNSMGNNNGEIEVGARTTTTPRLELGYYISYGGVFYFDSYDPTLARISASNSSWTGYLSANRTASNVVDAYKANSSTAHATLATGSGSGGSVPTSSLYVFAYNDAGSLTAPSSKRLSFVAFHDGLTSAESAIFYSLIQSFRTRIGGGYV